ncbi:hypothetical protein FHS78_000986 [Parvibaculum indicum]|uniref:hypothetical protein n=1 Tax=Parvibaculum indicum TaxID=562969 RepID=UPI001423155C|nr:hypothetical protein [Parvibaculum indicum]NIJ40710.1 hypothetical protein [Parvibaculum indicum]
MATVLRIALAAIILLLPLATAPLAHADAVTCHAEGTMETVMQMTDGHPHQATDPSLRASDRGMAGSHACCDLGSCSPALIATSALNGSALISGLPRPAVHRQRTALSPADGPPPRG